MGNAPGCPENDITNGDSCIQKYEGDNPAASSSSEWKTAEGFFVSVKRCRGLKKMDIGGLSDPYVRLKLRADQLGPQTQRTSIRTYTLDPTWEPPQSFRFLVATPSDATLIVTVYDWDRFKSDDVIGSAFIDLKEFIGRREVEVTEHLQDAADGKTCAASVSMKITHMPATQLMAFREDTIYEYQRHSGTKFGPNQLLPGDLGSHSSQDLQRWGNQFGDVEDPLPAGWAIRNQNWSFYVTTDDAQGWQYAFSQKSKAWWPTPHLNTPMRRRKWTRIVYDPAAVQPSDIPSIN